MVLMQLLVAVVAANLRAAAPAAAPAAPSAAAPAGPADTPAALAELAGFDASCPAALALVAAERGASELEPAPGWTKSSRPGAWAQVWNDHWHLTLFLGTMLVLLVGIILDTVVFDGLIIHKLFYRPETDEFHSYTRSFHE